MAFADEHMENSQHFLDNAEVALREVDLLQASEKLCGAAAHAVNSVAQRRGWSERPGSQSYTTSSM